MFGIRRRRANPVLRIREHHVALGFPLDDLTDEEIEKGVIAFGRLIASAGVTVEGAAKAMATVVGRSVR